MRSIYEADTEGEVALAAAGTVKTIYGVKGDAGHALDLLALAFSLDGITAAEQPVLVELVAVSFATQAPGTASTAVAVKNTAGPRIAETFAAAKNWTTEPTVKTILKPLDYDPYKFTFDREWPLGENYDFPVAEGYTIQMTIPSGGAAVNARVWSRWGRV